MHDIKIVHMDKYSIWVLAIKTKTVNLKYFHIENIIHVAKEDLQEHDQYDLCVQTNHAPQLIDQIVNGGEHDEMLFDTLAITYFKRTLLHILSARSYTF